ncbi:MAG: ABC transporter ATP-binding protein/permease [Clostridia bacterium]|nr:ABC transporter ATP-binding protein/permease [Clostridia bacterium]
MLEIRNLNKTYRSKTGESVKALDNVSIAFPESGMVFILGKSGSGKSTLLNIMGGLDSYDSGEFIIKGRSSKDFGGSDFDAYRNTFIGFIFQEYNVLDDFTVGANIGLALELQGKKATNEKINGILAKVDLLNYAKRKPNELSGGQKQRVAIARALVKEPQIIMADEPTGALDSSTGKQIFDTLKELSKEKLVLIVSHDRDFAEKYADRIIELSDGKIISDVTKHEKQSVQLSEGIQKINDNLLRIKGGYRLTANDLQMINDYLSANKNDIILSSDGRINDELRSAVGISAEGNTSVFEGTDTQTDYKLKEYKKEDSKFIRSKLPAKNALRIGASGLKHKKFRLVMTIFLSLIAFALFGFADTLGAYNKVTSAVDSMMDSNITSASVNLGVRNTITYSDGDSNTYFNDELMNDSDIVALRDKTGLDFVPVYNGGQLWGGGYSLSSMYQQYQSNTVYTGKMTGMVNMSQASVNDAGFAVTGSLPTTSGEIAITELLYRQFNEYGFVNTNFEEKIDANKITSDPNGADNSIIGKHITLNSNFGGLPQSYKIVGIVNTNFDYERYQSFLPKDESMPDVGGDTDITDMVLQAELANELNYGMHLLGFMQNDDIVALAKSSANQFKEIFPYMHSWGNKMLSVKLSPTEAFKNPNESDEKFDVSLKEQYTQTYNNLASDSVLKDLEINWTDGVARTTLADNEIIIPENYINRFMPYNATITVNVAELEETLKAICGEENWNNYSYSDNSYINRAYEAYLYKYIDDIFAKDGEALTVAVNKYRLEFHGITEPLTAAEARTFCKNWWYDGQYELPLYEYNKELKDRGTLSNEAYQAVTAAIVPYIADDILGIELPAEIQTDMPSFVISNIISVFNQINADSDGKITFERYNVENIIKSIDAYLTVKHGKLWQNNDFLALMEKEDYHGADKWEAHGEADKINYACDFYAYHYVQNSEWGGYENNAFGGKSGKELNLEADNMIRDLAGFSVDALTSMIKVELWEHDYELGNESAKYKYDDLKIVGFIKSGNYSEGIISNKLYNDYTAWYDAEMENSDWGYTEDRAEHENGIWSFAVAPLAKDRATIQNLVEMSYDENVDLKFSLQNAVMNTLDNFNDFIEIGAMIFLWVGVGFAVFSALLLMNFISTSISYKKREIGVLRAVGARSSDVFKIFFSEALIIALINFVLATATTVAAIIFTNGWMQKQGINITLLHFGARQIILMLLVSIVVALISSFLPVYNIARRKPIDAIRDK